MTVGSEVFLCSSIKVFANQKCDVILRQMALQILSGNGMLRKAAEIVAPLVGLPHGFLQIIVSHRSSD